MKRILLALAIFLSSLSLLFADPELIWASGVGVGYSNLATSRDGVAHTFETVPFIIQTELDGYTLFHNFGWFINIGGCFPGEAKDNGAKIKVSNAGEPIYLRCGFIGRLPITSNLGFEAKAGVGYQKDTKRVYLFDDSRSYLKRDVFTLIAGLSFYSYLTKDGFIGFRIGADYAYSPCLSGKNVGVEGRSPSHELYPVVSIFIGI